MLISTFLALTEAADLEVERCEKELRCIRRVNDVRHDFACRVLSFVELMECREEFDQLYGEYLGRCYGEGVEEPIRWMDVADLRV